ncbi:MAG: nitroreductase family protein [Clostridium sp.]|nr:nitroreductase family protein [Clostridium sp.]
MEDNYFLDRRTVRRYISRPVSDSLLEELIEKASHAPTTGNMQLYSVVATRDPEMKRRLAPAHFGQPSVEGASVVLTFCADLNRFVRWCELRGAQPGYDNFQAFTWALLDTALFAQQFCVAAETAGLGCCYLGTTTYNAPQIAELLELPELVVPVTTLTVGYPAEQPEDCGRLPVGGILHRERYRDYTPEQIDEIYREKEERSDSRRFVEENNKSNLAEVFTDIRYRREDNEYFSRVYADFIRQAGFQI